MLKQSILGASVLIVCTVIIFWFKSKPSEDVLILGTMSGWPPYVSINNNGDYEGYDIDIAKEIAQKLGKKLVIEDMDTAALLTALDQGKVDFIMTGLDITSDRLKKIAMISYQGEHITQLPLIFWKTIPEGIKTPSDLKGETICVEAGSSQENFLSQFSGFTVKNVDPLASILEIQYGRAKATLLEPSLFNNLKKKYPELVAVMIPLDENHKIFGCGIGVKKINQPLINKIEAIVNDLKKSGFLAQREKYWFLKDKS